MRNRVGSVARLGGTGGAHGTEAVDTGAGADTVDAVVNVELPPDPKILIVAPNPKTDEFSDTEAESHIDELEAALRGRNPLLARGGRLIVATTRDELRTALTRQPDVAVRSG